MDLRNAKNGKRKIAFFAAGLPEPPASSPFRGPLRKVHPSREGSVESLRRLRIKSLDGCVRRRPSMEARGCPTDQGDTPMASSMRSAIRTFPRPFELIVSMRFADRFVWPELHARSSKVGDVLRRNPASMGSR